MERLDWTHYNPVRVQAGPGLLARLAHYLPGDGDVLVVTTAGFVRRGVVATLIESLGARRVHLFDEVTPNPELDDLDHAAARFAGTSITAIVALGGGSVMDAAKVLSVALPCGFERALHGVLREGKRHAWAVRLPVVAVPTTSGTGAEVTPFATVWDHSEHRKHSVTGELVYPQVALLDPTLTLSLPADETLYTALDAVSHALESLWNKGRTVVSEAFATRALQLAVDALPRVLATPDELAARAQMQKASMLAGLAISQTRTAIAHSISYPLTLRFGVPHGLACSFTLVNVVSLYLEQHPDTPLRALMSSARTMLHGLDLFSHMAKYANREQIQGLQDEMLTPGRAENFDGEVPDLQSLVAPS